MCCHGKKLCYDKRKYTLVDLVTSCPGQFQWFIQGLEEECTERIFVCRNCFHCCPELDEV